MLAKSTAGCSSYVQRRFETGCRASIWWSDCGCGQPSVCPLLLGLCDLLQRALSQSSRSSSLRVLDKGTGNACRDTAFAGGHFSTLDLPNLAAITGALRNLPTRHTQSNPMWLHSIAINAWAARSQTGFESSCEVQGCGAFGGRRFVENLTKLRAQSHPFMKRFRSS
jgi:hypothetical protein